MNLRYANKVRKSFLPKKACKKKTNGSDSEKVHHYIHFNIETTIVPVNPPSHL